MTRKPPPSIAGDLVAEGLWNDVQPLKDAIRSDGCNFDYTLYGVVRLFDDRPEQIGGVCATGDIVADLRNLVEQKGLLSAICEAGYHVRLVTPPTPPHWPPESVELLDPEQRSLGIVEHPASYLEALRELAGSVASAAIADGVTPADA